jgi:hypothetical protein
VEEGRNSAKAEIARAQADCLFRRCCLCILLCPGNYELTRGIYFNGMVCQFNSADVVKLLFGGVGVEWRGMLRRVGCILLLVIQAIFFNIVVPGHTRGVIVMEGYKGGMASCCGEHSSSSSSKEPSKDRAGNCAICNFAAHVTMPPVIDLRLPELGFLHFRQVELAGVCVTPECMLTCYGRGPPVVG